MSIEHNYNLRFIASLALREKQIQQNYRPIIAVHKWFARRPGTLFRGLLLSEFGTGSLESIYYMANDFEGKRVADPFMGGGSPLIEANRVGCDVLGLDINPMSTWIVREQIERLDVAVYTATAEGMLCELHRSIGALYRTHCPIYGNENVPVKYFLWVKVIDCEKCSREL